MKSSIAHLTGIVRSIGSNRTSLTMLVLLGATAAFMWPGAGGGTVDLWSSQVANEGSPPVIVLVVIALIWLTLFPILLAMTVRPGSVRGNEREFGWVPHPPLPLSVRTRSILEAFLAITIIGIVRIPFVYLRDAIVGGSGVYPEFVSGSFLEGALLLLPMILVGFGKARNIETFWRKSGLVAVVVLAAAGSGALAGLFSLTVFSVLLGALVLLSERLDTTWRPSRTFGVFPLHRPWRKPEVQLRRDFIVRPIPMIVTFMVAEIVVVAIRWYGLFDGMAFYLASTIVFSLSVGFIVLRPFASSQAVAGVFGKAGHRPGDFGQAFSVLPVPRDLVIRTTYLHALITGAATWLAIIFVAAINARVALGEFLFFVDSEGRLTAEILLPLLAMVPCAAGYVVEGTIGDKKMAFFAGALLVLSPQIMMVLLVVAAPIGALAIVAVVVALTGGLLPLRHLRNEPPELSTSSL